MSRIIRMGIAVMTTAIALLVVPFAGAQSASDPPPAPIPIQILTGRKAFISNGENTAERTLGVRNLTYNEFYALMKGWGKYELVSAPADADLVFEIRFAGNNAVIVPTLTLVILDPKTRNVLWSLYEGVQTWSRQTTGRRNFDQAMVTLVDEVKKLTASPAAPTDAANK
jgi:hypothetical protein